MLVLVSVEGEVVFPFILIPIIGMKALWTYYNNTDGLFYTSYKECGQQGALTTTVLQHLTTRFQYQCLGLLPIITSARTLLHFIYSPPGLASDQGHDSYTNSVHSKGNVFLLCVHWYWICFYPKSFFRNEHFLKLPFVHTLPLWQKWKVLTVFLGRKMVGSAWGVDIQHGCTLKCRSVLLWPHFLSQAATIISPVQANTMQAWEARTLLKISSLLLTI